MEEVNKISLDLYLLLSRQAIVKSQENVILDFAKVC
jgi:hypothetical protein